MNVPNRPGWTYGVAIRDGDTLVVEIQYRVPGKYDTLEAEGKNWQAVHEAAQRVVDREIAASRAAGG